MDQVRICRVEEINLFRVELNVILNWRTKTLEGLTRNTRRMHCYGALNYKTK